MNDCGSKSGCKTSRCKCKDNGLQCKTNCSKCKCNPEYCENTNCSDDDDYNQEKDLKCNCAKTGCKNNLCGCKKNSQSCSKKCGCNNCENNGLSVLNDLEDDDLEYYKPDKLKKTIAYELITCCCESSKCNTNSCCCKKNGNLCANHCKCRNCQNRENVNRINIENIDDLASSITQQLRIKVTNKRDKVFEFRGNKDIYTLKPKDEVIDPNVDHIIEDQMLGRATVNVFKGTNQSIAPYLNSLKEALNPETLKNYNVTFGSTNKSKGVTIKNYLKDPFYKEFPLRASILIESPFGKSLEPIFQAMSDTHSIVEEYVSEGKRADGNISGSSKFNQIAEELNRIIEVMDLDVNSGRRLRSRKNN